MTRSLELSSADGAGQFSLYVAEPEGTPRAVLLVVQEIYGVNTDIRRKCDRYAQHGYLAVAPDLFWRLEPGVQLDPDVASTKERSIGLAIRFDTEAGIRDVQTTVDHARRLAGIECKVGLVGYSLGARMAAFAAVRTDVDAAVGYYGVRLPMILPEADRISCPLMLHIAGLDAHVGRNVQDELHRVLDDHPRVTLHDYAAQHHDFAYEFGPLRDVHAARLADGRTLGFLERHLA